LPLNRAKKLTKTTKKMIKKEESKTKYLLGIFLLFQESSSIFSSFVAFSFSSLGGFFSSYSKLGRGV